jgi:imidazole glycerol-phosphate synthase subunit HisH
MGQIRRHLPLSNRQAMGQLSVLALRYDRISATWLSGSRRRHYGSTDDYGMGNLHSACKALELVGGTTQVTDKPDQIWAADAILLPGVGSFDPAIAQLHAHDLVELLREVAASGKPFLGICVGMQVLFESSEEGQAAGLGIIPGAVQKFQPEPGLTIPHMGWNQLNIQQSGSSLWQDLPNDWMYFVHSYYAAPTHAAMIAATVTHGTQTVTAAIAHENVMATQFHPEKSASAGLKLLANFVESVKAELAIAA